VASPSGTLPRPPQEAGPSATGRGRPPRSPFFLRNLSLGALYEVFLVAAVISLLAIRGVLALSGFPRLGGHGLHIAHLLWGGLFMTAGLILLLGFVGRRVQFLAALLAGAGFGTFIDEIGKFVTSDNDYFFRPAVALIYVVFVLIFLAARLLEGHERFSDRELLANAFDLARENRLYDRRAAHSGEVLACLRKLPPGDPLVDGLRSQLEEAEEDPAIVPSALRRLQRRVLYGYLTLVRSRRLNRGVLAVFAAYAAFVCLVGWVVASMLAAAPHHLGLKGQTSYLGALASDAASLLLLAIGAVRLLASRLAAYRWLERAVLVNILLGQIFSFYLLQFGALAGLGFDLVVLLLAKGMARTERRLRAARRPTGPAAAPP
jgi:hypothetical protein